MSDDESVRPLGGIDTSRRSFLRKSAIASGGIALGGASVGNVTAQNAEDDEDGMRDGGDALLMLYPDAVENAKAQIVSVEVDWLPWEDHEEGDGSIGSDDGNESSAGNDDENASGIGSDDNGDGDPGSNGAVGTAQAEGYSTHLAQFEYSPSHVAPVFVPEGVDIGVDEDIQLGEFEEILHGPDEPLDGAGVGPESGSGDDESGVGDNGDTSSDSPGGNESEDDNPEAGTTSDGEGGAGLGMEDGPPILVRVTLEEDTTDDGTGGAEGNGVGTDDGAGSDADNESDDENGGVSGDDESGDNESEGEDDGGILSLV